MKYRKRRFVAEVESIEGRLLLSTAPQFTIQDLGFNNSLYPPQISIPTPDLLPAGPHGESWAYIHAMNDSGQSTGVAASPNGGLSTAFFYSNGSMINLTPGVVNGEGVAINKSGQVAGNTNAWVDPPGGFQHAFVTGPNGTGITFITDGVGARGSSQSRGINSEGDVVGLSYGSGHEAGFIYKNGILYNLNDLVQNHQGLTITVGVAIDDDGKILAQGTDSGGSTYFLLTPVPQPVAPTITWSNPADIVYGTPISATQLNATADVPGTFTYNVAEGTVLHAGAAQVIQATFTPDDLVHYTTATAEALINVTKRPIIVYANPVTKVYGAPVPDGSFYYTGWNNQQGFVNGDTPQSIGLNPVLYSAGTVNASTPVGVYNAFPLVSNMFDDYTVSTGGTTITITPAPLTVTANNAQVHYGFTIPPLTGTITGLVNGDTDVATYTTTAVRGSWAGYYPIVPHLTDPNYNITFVNGTLTIYWSVPPIG